MSTFNFDEPFAGVFDFNHDGDVDGAEMMMGLQMMASSRREAIELTGDDAFYQGSDELDEEEEEEDDDIFRDEFSDVFDGEDDF